MKDFADKIVLVFYGVLGAGLGGLVFLFACDGWSYVLTGKASSSWNGALGLALSCLGGGGLGVLAGKYGDRELGAGGSSLFDNSATALLFSKRVLVIAGCLAAIYYLWQLADRL
jgi:hypothetical protein